MLVNPIDPTPYVRTPRLGVDTGLSLAKMLLMLVPEKASPGVTMAAQQLAAAVSELETVWSGHGKPTPPRDARPADRRVDRGWNAVHARLTAWGIFPEDDPDRQSSEALTERLFPTGLDFLKLPFLAEHAQSERRLKIIEDEDLRDDLDELVGEAFMEELIAAHAEYGDALGITSALEAEAPRELLVEPLRALNERIVAYAVQVIAYAALDEENVAKARRALEPIDRFRAAAGRRGSGGAGAAEDFPLPEGAPAPDAPMPALPEG